MHRPYEMREDEYIHYRFEREKQQCERELAARQTELASLSGRAQKRRVELSLRVSVLAQYLKEIQNNGLALERESRYRREYMRLVKDAIRRGESVPSTVIAQRVEFERAVTGRQRYEKGRHTSFANHSIAVDTRLAETRGFKAKLQNGEPMRADILDEIVQGLDEIEAVIGSLCNLLHLTDITIVHTRGKHPFMRGDASGLYLPSEKTVTIGTATRTGCLIRSLAHELLGHWLDYEAGKSYGASTRVRKGQHYIDASALSEYSVRHGANNPDRALREDGYLIALAASRMQDQRLAVRVTRKKSGDLHDLTAEDIEIYKFILGRGNYWLAPREVLARLCEEFCAKRAAAPQLAFEPFDWYTHRAAYWSEEDFTMLEPLVEKALRWRLNILNERTEAK